MHTNNRALVALDLSATDDDLLRFTARMAPVLGLQKIYFLHVMPSFSAPAQVDVAFQKLFSPEYPVDERVRDRIAAAVQPFFESMPGIELSVEVVEGSPYEKLLHWVEVKEIDLLVVGNKQHSDGSGIIPRRVARKANCQVLFVPSARTAENGALLVPVDFSDNALRALKTALSLRNQRGEGTVRCIYVVDLPPSDYYIRTFENVGYRQVLLDAAKQTYRKFINENQIPEDQLLEPVFVPNDYNNVAVHLCEYAEQNNLGLLILGAVGHSAFENFIYGSVAESLVERSKKIPILIVR